MFGTSKFATTHLNTITLACREWFRRITHCFNQSWLVPANRDQVSRNNEKLFYVFLHRRKAGQLFCSILLVLYYKHTFRSPVLLEGVFTFLLQNFIWSLNQTGVLHVNENGFRCSCSFSGSHISPTSKFHCTNLTTAAAAKTEMAAHAHTASRHASACISSPPQIDLLVSSWSMTCGFAVQSLGIALRGWLGLCAF